MVSKNTSSMRVHNDFKKIVYALAKENKKKRPSDFTKELAKELKLKKSGRIKFV